MLEHTINEMNRTFLRFNDQAMASDICGYKPVLGEALRVAVEHFLELAQTLSPEPDPEDDGPVRIEHTPDFLSGNSPDQNTSHSPEILQNHSVPLIPQKPANPAPADMWGYSLINDTRSDPGRGNDDGNEFVLGKDYSTGRELDSDRHNSLAEERLKLDFPGPAALFPSPANSIKSPYTYSFQESTFARRLLRSCLERTYHLMTSPNRSQQEIDRIFRFSFCWGTDKDIIKGLRTLLTRTSKEPLELWNAPRLHLGGSGLHFPRGGLDGDSPAPELWWAKQPIGPNKLRLGTSLTSSSIDGDPTSELDDMEGEWYDPNDVEQYLRTKGLFLDGHSSLADVEVDVSLPPLAVDTSSGSGSSPVSGQDPVSPATDSDALSIAYTRERDSYLSTSNIDLSDVSDANFDSMDGLDFSSVWTSDMDLKALQNFGDSQITTINNLSVHQPMVSTTRRLTVDVNKFIEGAIPFSKAWAPTDSLCRITKRGRVPRTNSWI